MAVYHFLNGYKNFYFEAEKNGRKETLEFSFKWASFVESYEKISIRREYLNGKRSKKILHFNLKWEIDYPQHLEASDLKEWARLEALENAGYVLTLIPHEDTEDVRKFKVQIIDQPRSYGLQYHHRGRKSTAHKGYKMAVETIEPVYDLGFVDMNEYTAGVHLEDMPQPVVE